MEPSSDAQLTQEKTNSVFGLRPDEREEGGMSMNSTADSDRNNDGTSVSEHVDEASVLGKLEKALEASLAEIELASALANSYGAQDIEEAAVSESGSDPSADESTDGSDFQGRGAKVEVGLKVAPPWLTASPPSAPGDRRARPDLQRQLRNAGTADVPESARRIQVPVGRTAARREAPLSQRHGHGHGHGRPLRPANEFRDGVVPLEFPHQRGPSEPNGQNDDVAWQEDVLRRLTKRPPAEADELLERSPSRRRPLLRVGQAVLFTVLAGGVAFGLLHLLNLRPTTADSREKVGVASLALGRNGIASTATPARKALPRLVTSTISGAMNRPVAFGVNVNGAAPGASIVVRGLPSGGRMTVGSAAENGTWRVPVRELAGAAVMPPPDFVGTMNLSVDLRLADGGVVDSDIQKLNWKAGTPDFVVPKPVTTTAVKPRPVPAPTPNQTAGAVPQGNVGTNVADRSMERAPAAVVRRLEQDEIANLLRRGMVALQNDDIAAARLLLRRAAEAGNAQAALALAATYDPMTLKEFGALGAKADAAQAKHWYRRAADAGSTEARQRLQLIARQLP
jgi:hypothetical protein